MADAPDLVAFDMGGTSTDISIILGGERPLTSARGLAGERIALPSLDIASIGAGGGSIARVDEGGLLRVGPASAGAEPGPACYGRGGTMPTVTDANLVLGHLDEAGFLEGRMRLDRAAARHAVAGVARALGRGIEEAAAGKIPEERRGRSVGLPGVALVKVVALVVAVPAVLVDGVVELHDAHTAFDHAAREQTHPTVGCGGPMRVVDRIEGEGLRCIAGEVTDIRGLGLHPVGKLVGRDPPVELGLPGASVTMAPVERLREIECRALHRGEAGLAGDACVYQ
jgi:hypothetical protein